MKDRFIDAATVSSLHHITPKIGAMTIGLARISLITQPIAEMLSLDFKWKLLITSTNGDIKFPQITQLQELLIITKTIHKKLYKEFSEYKQLLQVLTKKEDLLSSKLIPLDTTSDIKARLLELNNKIQSISCKNK